MNAYFNLVNLGYAFAETGTRSLPRIPKAPSAPPAPTISLITPTTLRVSYSAPSDNGGSGITSYQIQRSRNNFATQDALTSDGGSPLDVTDLIPGTDYWFRLRAINAIGAGPWSASAYAKTLAGVYVSRDGGAYAPAEVRVSRNGGSYQLVEVLQSVDGAAYTPAG